MPLQAANAQKFGRYRGHRFHNCKQAKLELPQRRDSEFDN
jgi:hypothetical protein